MAGFAAAVMAVDMRPDRHGVERLGGRFKFTEQALRRNKPFLDEVGFFMLNSVRQNFAAAGRPVKWRPLAQSTVESRVQGVESRAIARVVKRAIAAEKRLQSGQSVSFQGRAALGRRIASRAGGDILSTRGRAAVRRQQEVIAPGGRTSNQPSHLRWTGKLLASLRAETRASGPNVGRVRVYSLSKYARIHQMGGRIQHPGAGGVSQGADIDLQVLKQQEAAASGRKYMAFKWGGKVIFTPSVRAHTIRIWPRPFLLFQPGDARSITQISKRYLDRAVSGSK